MQHRVLCERLKHDLVEVGRREKSHARLLGPIDDAGHVVGHCVGAIRWAGDGRSCRDRHDYQTRGRTEQNGGIRTPPVDLKTRPAYAQSNGPASSNNDPGDEERRTLNVSKKTEYFS